MATEQHLESLLNDHPYLLAAELGRRKPTRQLRMGKSRLDLLFELKGGFCVVELKKTPLSHYDARQLARYCRLLIKKGLPLYHHYLVGFRPADINPLEKEIARLAKFSIKVRLRFLGEHVPLTVLWDVKKRRYVRFQSEFYNQGDCLQLRF